MGCGASVPGSRALMLQQKNSRVPLRRIQSGSVLEQQKDKVMWPRRQTNPSLGFTRTPVLRSRDDNGNDKGFWKIRRRPKNSMLLCGYLKNQSAYGRRHPTDAECKFIEQRVTSEARQEEEYSEVDDAATNSTTTTTVSTSSSGSRNFKPRIMDIEVEKPVRAAPMKRSFLRGALDYNKKLAEIRGYKAADANNNTVKVLTKQKSSITMPVDAPIVQHISRREFLDDCGSLGTPPLLTRRAFTPTSRSSVHGSKETLTSERSFIVQHNTFRVAWEKDIYHERIREQRRRKGDSIESGDGSENEDEFEGEERRKMENKNILKQRAAERTKQWSAELEKIVIID
ncbi:unnamed protein product [Bursaphelenchus xylophilus]|uniref:(pine wood nematode) hypothetical protein n=1 Tax=Bursaphelenchus xylophilus TaxID=6326 RepID=A0A1I7SEL9_BURXY|nr:unnamed protein product [Bursaphelenchus xylophilus]CAG9113634.1 unnamed protein product [Bursaphelenchus xylophilus]